jgi:hypothetical protein
MKNIFIIAATLLELLGLIILILAQDREVFAITYGILILGPFNRQVRQID